MPLRSDWSSERCPIARSLEVLGDPWVLLVLRQAFSGVRRFDQLRSELKIADNVLSSRLTRLVDAGLLRRVPYQDHQRTRYEYVLTDAGADTFPVITALAQWGERQRPHPDPDVRMDVVHRSVRSADDDGRRVQPVRRAPDGGDDVVAEDVAYAGRAGAGRRHRRG